MFKLVKNVINYVKLNVEYYGDIKNDNNNPMFKPEEINADGYIMRKCSGKLMRNHIAIAGMVLVNFGDDLVPCIFVDKLFEKMSKNCQDFIIQHELGHFEYHKDQVLNGYARNDKMENEADEYAAQIIGHDNVILALKEIKEMLGLFSLYCNKYGMKEIDRRIEYIERAKNI